MSLLAAVPRYLFTIKAATTYQNNNKVLLRQLPNQFHCLHKQTANLFVFWEVHKQHNIY